MLNVSHSCNKRQSESLIWEVYDERPCDSFELFKVKQFDGDATSFTTGKQPSVSMEKTLFKAIRWRRKILRDLKLPFLAIFINKVAFLSSKSQLNSSIIFSLLIFSRSCVVILSFLAKLYKRFLEQLSKQVLIYPNFVCFPPLCKCSSRCYTKQTVTNRFAHSNSKKSHFVLFSLH